MHKHRPTATLSSRVAHETQHLADLMDKRREIGCGRNHAKAPPALKDEIARTRQRLAALKRAQDGR